MRGAARRRLGPKKTIFDFLFPPLWARGAGESPKYRFRRRPHPPRPPPRMLRAGAARTRTRPAADEKHDDGEDALEQTRAGSRGWRRRICGGVHRWTRGRARDRAGTAGRPAQHRDGRWRRVREHRVLHSQRSSPPARLSPLLCIAHGAKSRLCAHNPCFERRDDALDRVHAPRRRSSTAFLELLQRQRAVPRGNGLT